MGEDAFLVAGPSAIFKGKETTHLDLTIFTMCKISRQTRVKLLICNDCIIILIK